MRKSLAAMAILPLVGCAAPAPPSYMASKKPALELRSIETRVVAENQDTAMRDTIATLQDLGYRITRVEPDAGTISATRQTALRLAVAIRPRSDDESVVRANASIVGLGRESQVDSPAFYQRDFFDPLGATTQREIAALPQDVDAPDAVRPVAELNSARDREKAASKAATNSTPPQTSEVKTP